MKLTIIKERMMIFTMIAHQYPLNLRFKNKLNLKNSDKFYFSYHSHN